MKHCHFAPIFVAKLLFKMLPFKKKLEVNTSGYEPTGNLLLFVWPLIVFAKTVILWENVTRQNQQGTKFCDLKQRSHMQILYMVYINFLFGFL